MTVTPLPAACSIRFRSSSAQAVNATSRARPIRRSNAVSAPSGHNSRRSVPGRLARSRRARRQRRGEAAARATPAAADPRPRALSAAPDVSSRTLVGAGSGRHGSGAGCVSSSSASQSNSESMRRQVTPSARQWWMRITSAVRPSWPGPTTSTHHSGRAWSSRSAIRFPTIRISACAVWGRLRYRSDVVSDLEVLVVDPCGRGDPQRCRRQAPAGARDVAKPRLDPLPHALHRQRLPVVGRLDDRELQRMRGDRV